LWEFKTKGSVKNTFCYFDGKILATDVYGIAYAIDANTGDLIWKKELGQKSLGAFNTGSVVHNGVYYTGFGNYLQALDARTGKTLWKNEDWRGGEGATPTMIVAGDVLIASSNWRALYAHDIKTGKMLWKLGDKGYRFRSSSATWKNDTLYVASDKGIGLLNARTGEIYKYFETGFNLTVSTKPLIINDLLIMGTKNNGLVAFNRYDGKVVWKVMTGEALIYTSPYSRPESHTVETPPVLVNESIVFGASDGFVYWVDPEDGEVIEKYNLGAPVFGAVAPYLNGFFITDFGGNVYRFIMKGFKYNYGI
jgi:outer membrane protein assembly factor BamB